MHSKSLKISQRIFEVRTHFNLTKEALGELAEVSGTSIANIESGVTKNPGTDLLSAIASKLGVDGHWLLTGEGDMLKTPSQNAEAPKTLSYMPDGLFPKEAPLPGFTPAETTELHGQLIQTRLPPGMGTPKPAPKQLPGQDLLETVAKQGEALTQLRQEVAELRERVEKG
jgi:transcriptional regulator with XRE-family HTH domain